MVLIDDVSESREQGEPLKEYLVYLELSARY